MEKRELASRLVRLARELVAGDSTTDIATDIVTRMSAGMSMQKAFKAVGQEALYKKTRAADMPDDFEEMSKKDKIKALAKHLSKVMKKASERTAAKDKAVYQYNDGTGVLTIYTLVAPEVNDEVDEVVDVMTDLDIDVRTALDAILNSMPAGAFKISGERDWRWAKVGFGKNWFASVMLAKFPTSIVRGDALDEMRALLKKYSIRPGKL